LPIIARFLHFSPANDGKQSVKLFNACAKGVSRGFRRGVQWVAASIDGQPAISLGLGISCLLWLHLRFVGVADCSTYLKPKLQGKAEQKINGGRSGEPTSQKLFFPSLKFNLTYAAAALLLVVIFVVAATDAIRQKSRQKLSISAAAAAVVAVVVADVAAESKAIVQHGMLQLVIA